VRYPLILLRPTVLGGIASIWILGCSVNRAGLTVEIRESDGGDVDDGAQGNDVLDAPLDIGIGCDGVLGFHRCGDECVSNTNVDNCGTSCTACPVPRNGSAICDGTSCGIVCNQNFAPQGSTCVASCNAQCEGTAINVPLPGGRFTGSEGAWANAGSCGGAAAPETAYRLVLTAASDVFVTTHGTGFDTVVYMRRGCCGAELGCNDNADGRNTSVLAQTDVPPGVYYIFVDGATAAAAGAFTVDIYATPTSDHSADACGNPTRIANAPVAGNTCGYRHDYDPQQGCLNATSSYDAVYYFVLDTPSMVSFNTCAGTCIDSVLYVRDVCSVGSSQRLCADDSCDAPESCFSNSHQTRLSGTLSAGVHYLVLDTYPDGPPVTCGAFTITPTGISP
jgi:hypothetical protein